MDLLNGHKCRGLVSFLGLPFGEYGFAPAFASCGRNWVASAKMRDMAKIIFGLASPISRIELHCTED